MIRYFCDICTKEVDSPALMNKLTIPCHQWSLKHKAGYVDKDGNQISGRTDSLLVCTYCSNEAYAAMSAKLKELMELAKIHE